MKKKEQIEEDLYKKASLNDLILFGIHIASGNKKGCGFEKLTFECFRLFPKAFSLLGYNKWPDTRKLDRPLRSLRKEKFLSGNPRQLFSLTKKGKKRALEIAKIFRQKKLL
jgi:hypothetical protein